MDTPCNFASQKAQVFLIWPCMVSVESYEVTLRRVYADSRQAECKFMTNGRKENTFYTHTRGVASLIMLVVLLVFPMAKGILYLA